MKCISIYLVLFTFMRTSIASFCFWNSGCPYKYFGSKTSYNFIRGDIRDSIIRLKETGCQPVSIWAFYRHGKRYPSKKYATFIKSILNVQNYVETSYAAGVSSLCAQDVENLKQWKPDMRLFENPEEMTEDGLMEMEGLGKRIKEAFPKLLSNLKEEEYHFQASLGRRMEESLDAFINGFNNDNLNYKKAKGYAAPFKVCKSFQREFHNETSLYAESNLYYNNPEWLAMEDRVQRRTGVKYLTDDRLRATYDICRYDSSGSDNILSPWCALFTKEDLLVLEYEDDLRHYYRHGYGHNHTENFGRIALTDLLDRFKQVKEGNGPKITVYVSHATMLDTMYKALDLFRDEETLTAGYRDPNRKWRTTNKSTFSANLVAVLNRCPENNVIEYNVVFYLNEEPLMSICKQGVCTWEEFEQKLTFTNITLDFCGGFNQPGL